MKEITSCPICEREKLNHFMTTKNFRIDFKDFDIVECAQCNFRFTNPIPTEDEIGVYYNSENYISHTETKKGIVNFLFHIVRKYTLGQKFRLVKKYVESGTLLDIGCGSGRFLNYVKEKGWKVTGLEPDAEARAFCKSEHNIDVYPAENLPVLQENSADAITMWHVLEHVHNLNEDVQSIKKILKPNGTLFVAVPNCSSYDARKYKEHWSAYDLPIHLYHFRPNNIKQLFEKHHMKVVMMKPMVFDAYWISLESEKYKAGKKKFTLPILIRGFWFGLLSNLKAKNGTYSSQIYIIQHK